MTDVVLTFAGYEIREVLDVDLVSTTYKAVTASRNGPVTLRIIAEDVLDGESFDLAESVRETLWQAARVDHPNLLPILDVGLFERSLYAVTEFVPGMSLAALIAREGALDEEVALSIVGQIGGALDTIHQEGIVHGAINPHTIWIAQSDRSSAPPRAYLTAFGTTHLLAQRVRRQGKAPAPADVFYVDPEQLRQQPLTGRADQYALAGALFHSLVGEPPFVRDTVNALFGAHLFAKPTPPSQLPPRIDAAMARALAKDPGDRFASCEAFIREAGGSTTVPKQHEPVDPDATDRTIVVDGAAPASMDATGEEASSVDATDGRPAGAGHVQDLQQASASEAPPAPVEPAKRPPAGRERQQPRRAEPERQQRQRVGPTRQRSQAAPPGQKVPPATEPPSSDPRPPGSLRSPSPKPSSDRRASAEPQLQFVPEHAKPRTRPRWLVAAVVGLILLAALLVLVAFLLGRDDPEVAGQPDEAEQAPPADAPEAEAEGPERTQGRPPRVVGARWSTAIGTDAVQAITRAQSVVAVGVGDQLVALNIVTGDQNWQASAGGEVLEVEVVGDVLVARTPDSLHAFDVGSGEERWTFDNPSAVIASIAAGRSLLYGATSDDTEIRIIAFDPQNGEPLWDIPELDPSPSGDVALDYDQTERDGEMLYVLQDAGMYGIDTGSASVRWHIDVEEPWVQPVQAIAAAAFITHNDGSICRYAADDGREVWTFCQELASVEQAQPHLHVRSARVIVATADDVTAFDFTNGLARWRLTAADELQSPVAGNHQAVYIAKTDGTVRALDHESGIERWRADGFGDVTTMVADVDGVYIGSADGSLSRVQETVTSPRSGR